MLSAHAVKEILLDIEDRPHRSAIHAMKKHFCLQKTERFNMYLCRKVKRHVLTRLIDMFSLG